MSPNFRVSFPTGAKQLVLSTAWTPAQVAGVIVAEADAVICIASRLPAVIGRWLVAGRAPVQFVISQPSK